MTRNTLRIRNGQTLEKCSVNRKRIAIDWPQISALSEEQDLENSDE